MKALQPGRWARFAVATGLVAASLAGGARAEVSVHQCLDQAAKHYGVDWRIIRSIREVEGGWNGAQLRNSNGTVDRGVMQINSTWTERADLRATGVTPAAVRNSECVSYWVGTWIYARELAAANGDVWRAAGNYHSKTPKFHLPYLAKVKAAYVRLFGDVPPAATTYIEAIDDDRAYELRCRTPTSEDELICTAWSMTRDLDLEIATLKVDAAGGVPESDDDLADLVAARLQALER